MSQKQRDLRLKIKEATDEDKIRRLRSERSQILDEVPAKVKEAKQDSLDLVLSEFESTPDNAKMFKSVKFLLRGKRQNPTMKDGNNHTITSPEERYEGIKDHFQQHFFKNDIDEQESDTSYEPLDKPITESEVKSALKKMKNGKAAGFDGISVELLKYGPDILVTCVTSILNGAFEQHADLKLGHGILVPLQKPGKKKGIFKNLRPVILLPTIRKLMSLITLNPICSATEQRISDSQSSGRQGRGTTDVVWGLKWLVAKSQKFQMEVYLTGIDMSAAFGTIDGKQLINTYHKILPRDEVRLLTKLLTETNLKIKIESCQNHEIFTTNNGSPQGDELSGVNYNVYFENSLRDGRQERDKAKPPAQLGHDYSIPKSNKAIHA